MYISNTNLKPLTMYTQADYYVYIHRRERIMKKLPWDKGKKLTAKLSRPLTIRFSLDDYDWIKEVGPDEVRKAIALYRNK